MKTDNSLSDNNEVNYFYYKNSSRKIVPFPDNEIQEKAFKKLLEIKETYLDTTPLEFQKE
jgi:hypothetical protein